MFELPHGQVYSLHTVQGGAVHVLTGRVWVTTNQSADDYFLEAGESLTINAGAHVVLETWNQSKEGCAMFDWAQITSPHPPSPAQTSAASQSPPALAE